MLKKQVPNTCTRKLWKKVHPSTPQTLIFVTPLMRNRSFHFSIFGQNVTKMVPKCLQNGSLRIPSAPKTQFGARSKTSLKNRRQTSAHICQKYGPKGDPKTWYLGGFWGSGSQGAPGRFQGPSQGVKSEPKGAKMESNSHPKSINIDKNGFEN